MSLLLLYDASASQAVNRTVVAGPGDAQAAGLVPSLRLSVSSVAGATASGFGVPVVRASAVAAGAISSGGLHGATLRVFPLAAGSFASALAQPRVSDSDTAPPAHAVAQVPAPVVSVAVSRAVTAPAGDAWAYYAPCVPCVHMPMLGSQLAQHAYAELGLVGPVDVLTETFPNFGGG